MIAAVVGVLIFRHAEREGQFDLTTVRVDNSGPVDSALVAEVLKPFFGESLLSLDPDSVRNAIMEIEGLSSVTVEMHFPNSMVVAMVPRAPVARILNEGGWFPVDMEGRVLPSAWDSSDLPELRIQGNPDEAYIVSGIDLLVKNNLAEEVSITVDNSGLKVRERDNLILMSGLSTRADWNTWTSLRDLIGETPCIVDLRYSGQAVVRSGEGTGV